MDVAAAGRNLKVAAERDQTVEEGAPICFIEATKMDNEITAHEAGVAVELGAAVGAAVSIGDTLVVIAVDRS